MCAPTLYHYISSLTAQVFLILNYSEVRKLFWLRTWYFKFFVLFNYYAIQIIVIQCYLYILFISNSYILNIVVNISSLFYRIILVSSVKYSAVSRLLPQIHSTAFVRFLSFKGFLLWNILFCYAIKWKKIWGLIVFSPSSSLQGT